MVTKSETLLLSTSQQLITLHKHICTAFEEDVRNRNNTYIHSQGMLSGFKKSGYVVFKSYQRKRRSRTLLEFIVTGTSFHLL